MLQRKNDEIFSRHLVGRLVAGSKVANENFIGFVYTGWHISTLPQWSTGFVYWPAVAGIVVASMLTAPLGAYLAHVLPTHVLKRLFAVVLAIVGARMLIGA